MSEGLLFLCHRIPFPPNKGDKIRSFHILKHLSTNYGIHLAAFVDDPKDSKYIKDVSEFCNSTCIKSLNPLKAKIRSLRGFLSRQPLSVPYYYDAGMDFWIKKTIEREKIKTVFVFSSSMAQYIVYKSSNEIRKIIDFVDIDSDKWRQYSEKKTWPMNWVYKYESKELFKYEKKIAHIFDTSFFVTEKESEMFKKLVPDVSNKILFFNNGVDVDYFSPDHKYQNPYSEDDGVIVFTGAMDYWANVDAVCWFVNNVFVELLKLIPGLKFYIVGSKPALEVRQLANISGVIVTGTVEDVRPYIRFASVTVAPMRIARGVQNKVLEAMAMAKVVITSAQGYEGIHAQKSEQVFVVDGAQEWQQKILKIIGTEEFKHVGQAARQYILDNYTWENSLSKLDDKLEL